MGITVHTDQVAMDENFMNKKFEQQAASLGRKYGDILTEAEQAYNEHYSKYGKSWSIYDTVTLGSYLNNWEDFMGLMEADPSTRDTLGDYMKLGLGLAAIQYLSLPASFLASVQPMNDEIGMIYFRELVATATRGNITDGDIIGTQGGKLSRDLDTYYTEKLTKTTTIVKDTAAYSIALSAPVRARTIQVTITKTTGGSTYTYNGIDDGNGNLYGSWPTPVNTAGGTINYETGAAVVNMIDTEADVAGTIVIVYHQNLAQASTVPGFQYRLASKEVRANYFILENQYSTLADYSIRKRFGQALSDDVAISAVSQINAAVLSSMIRQLGLAAASTGNVNFDAEPEAGVSIAEHRRTFPDAMEAAAQLIDEATGRGAISFMVAGAYTRRILQTIGVDMVRKPLPGPYLMGYFQNIPVFYAPASLVANDKCIVGYRGPSWFESPIVYAPYLPIVMVKGTSATNVFNRRTGVAHAAGIDLIQAGFAAQITITNMIP